MEVERPVVATKRSGNGSVAGDSNLLSHTFDL